MISRIGYVFFVLMLLVFSFDKKFKEYLHLLDDNIKEHKIWKDILGVLPDGVLIMNEDYGVLYKNEEFKKFLS